MILDEGAFPVVRWSPPPFGAPGRAEAIRGALDHLLARGEPFAVVMPLDPDLDAEPAADRQDRNAWYAVHGERYFALQKAAVWLEPDRTRWPKLRDLADRLMRAVPTPIALAASEAEAIALARQMFDAA